MIANSNILANKFVGLAFFLMLYFKIFISNQIMIKIIISKLYGMYRVPYVGDSLKSGNFHFIIQNTSFILDIFPVSNLCWFIYLFILPFLLPT
ncbi:hypothetical protein ACJX0J_026020, partial [Zea mays]